MNLRRLYQKIKYKLFGPVRPSGIYNKISRTKNIPHPNIYVQMLDEYKNWIYTEEEAISHKGKWKNTFSNPQLPLDLEIGCGNGFFFEHVVSTNLDRNHLGIELKYKPLVQTVRRIKKLNLPNGKGIRFNARYLEEIFAPEELHNVFIHFPDPWPKKKHAKNRYLTKEFFKKLYKLQKSGHVINFKTDSESYFDFVVEEIKATPYKVSRYTRDLHKSEWSSENFITAFEKIFTRKGQPTFYMRFEKN